MAIALECECGTGMQVPDQAAGRRTQCPRCGRLLMVPGAPVETVPEAAGEQRPSFWASAPRAFVYPLTRKGIGLLVGAGLLFALLSPGKIHPFSPLGLILMFVFIVVYGYLAAALLNIIQSSAAGDREMPDWPGLTDILDDIVRPFLRTAAAFLVAFAPLLIVCWIREGFPLTEGASSWALLTLGTLYLPMALLAVAVHQTALAASPHVVIPAIGRTLLPTVTVAAMLWVSLAGYRLAEAPVVKWQGSVTESPFLIFFIAALLNAMRFYFIAVVGRLIGIIHWHYGRELGWLRNV